MFASTRGIADPLAGVDVVDAARAPERAVAVEAAQRLAHVTGRAVAVLAPFSVAGPRGRLVVVGVVGGDQRACAGLSRIGAIDAGRRPSDDDAAWSFVPIELGGRSNPGYVAVRGPIDRRHRAGIEGEAKRLGPALQRARLAGARREEAALERLDQAGAHQAALIREAYRAHRSQPKRPRSVGGQHCPESAGSYPT